MTSIFKDNRLVACTVLETQPCVITQIKTQAQDGYEAVQIACEEKKEKNTSKALQGHFKKAQTTPKKKLVEFRNFRQDYAKEGMQVGDGIKAADIFEEAEFIDAVGLSKAKGFCGVVKRHGFKGAKEATHGQKHTLRAPGSIGNVEEPVSKGKRMAGRAGGNRITVKNLEVLKIIPEKNLLLIKGSMPGPRKNYIVLQK